MSSIDSALREIQTRPCVALWKLTQEQRVLVDACGSAWEISVVDPEQKIISIYSTDATFRDRPAGINCYYIGAWLARDRRIEVEGKIIKGMRMAFRFEDGIYVSEVVEAASVHGNGWHFEAI